MEENILLTFDVEDKILIFYTKKDSNEVLYGYKNKNSERVYEITDSDDIIFMNEIYKISFVSKDSRYHVKLGIIKLNGKRFQKMYDRKSKLIFFCEIKNDDLFPVENEDLAELVCMYNIAFLYRITDFEELEQPVESPRDFNKSQSRFVRKIKKIMGKTVILLYSSLSLFTINDLQNLNLNMSEAVISKEEKEDPDSLIEYIYPSSGSYYTEDEIKSVFIDALNSNDKLSDDERKFILKYLPVILKYKDYLDVDFVTGRIKSLYMTYDPQKKDYDGEFDPDLIKLTIYGTKNIKEADQYTIGHELGHALFSRKTSRYDIEVGAEEGFIEVLAQEVFYGSPNRTKAYIEHTGYIKILCEIIGSEPVIASIMSSDLRYITNALIKIIPDRDMAYKLISDLSESFYFTNYYKYSGGDYSIFTPMNKYHVFVEPDPEHPEYIIQQYYHTFYEKYKDSEMDLFNAFSRYFYEKYGYGMEYDALISLYYEKYYKFFNFQINSPYNDQNKFVNSADIYPNVEKGYFDPSYIEEFPEAVVSFYYPTEIYKDYIDLGHGYFIEPGDFKKEVYNDIIINENNRRLKNPFTYDTYTNSFGNVRSFFPTGDDITRRNKH